MCNFLHRFTAILAVALLWPLAVLSQQRPEIQFDQVQVGFSAVAEDEVPDARGRFSLHKAGFWAPVYVSFTSGVEARSGTLVVESTDSDDVQNNYTIALPPGGLHVGETYHFLSYTKPGSASGDINVLVHTENRTYETKTRFDALGPPDVFFLTLGSRLPGLRQTLAQLNEKGSRASSMRAAFVDPQFVGMLPTEWFGYSGVDLLILTTGNRDFVSDLLREKDKRKEALAEWVRRGGRLVISLGRNQDMIPALFERMQMDLPVTIAGNLAVPNLESLQGWLPPGVKPLNQAAGKNPRDSAAPIEVARLERKPGRDLEFIVPSREGDKSPPVLVRAPYGLGQVVLVAFDLDQKPFSSWAGQPDFWKKLHEKLRAKPFEPAPVSGMPRYNANQFGNELAGAMERSLENFTDIPVISFGWVALFILIYILIVGPLDYFFLKKVVKRLELTWITFPTVVLVVSAVAYFAAYAIKGNDLKINKLDLIDIDLHNGRSYGNTWFTVFSPRIQLYTVGVEPTFPAGPPAGERDVTVTWLGRPDEGYGGYGRARSQSLFRRTYDYAPSATGLRGVPIQVWSTKSFTASWERPLDTSKALIEADLRLQQPLPVVEGTLTSHLPVALDEAVLIHSEGRTDSNIKVYSIGTLQPGKPFQVSAGTQSRPLGQWVSEFGTGATETPGMTREIPLPSLMRRVMFHGASPQEVWGNSSLQSLDQSWRRNFQGEAILVGHIAKQEGPCETVAEAPATPSRLWLGELPGSSAPRPPLAGKMVQETYVRMFIPIAAPARADAKPAAH
jgi:hypothetical protein